MANEETSIQENPQQFSKTGKSLWYLNQESSLLLGVGGVYYRPAAAKDKGLPVYPACSWRAFFPGGRFHISHSFCP